MDVSIVIPLYNESESVELIGDLLYTELSKTGKSFEIIFVDDGSEDNTFIELKKLKQRILHVKIIKLRTNQGKSTAYSAGFEYCKGDYVITMDGDLQDDPSDIPRIIKKIEEGYDVVIGWKHGGKGSLSRTIPSICFNLLVSLFTGLKIHDVNCPFRIFKRHALKNMYLYGELYRFIPILLYKRGYRIAEVHVKNKPRRFGRSKYGISRFMKGILDLMTLISLSHYTDRPLHFFGSGRILLFVAGFCLGFYFSIQGVLLLG